MTFITEDPRGLILKVHLQPRSSKNAVEGLHGDALKIKVKAPPVDGAANKMCIQYLAKRLGVPKSSLEIISGFTSRTKRVLLRHGGGKPTEAHRKEQKRLLESLLDP